MDVEPETLAFGFNLFERMKFEEPGQGDFLRFGLTGVSQMFSGRAGNGKLGSGQAFTEEVDAVCNIGEPLFLIADFALDAKRSAVADVL